MQENNHEPIYVGSEQNLFDKLSMDPLDYDYYCYIKSHMNYILKEEAKMKAILEDWEKE